nr:hypothetical protein [Tanacetum cinerariifolium]
MVQLRALIDKKKVVVIEDVIRRDLRLVDADGVECLPNEEIFTELARMGYEKPHPKPTFYKARMHLNRGKIETIDANEDITLVDVKTHKEVVTIDAEPQGRINQEDDKDIFGVNDSDGDEVIVEDAEMLFDVADDLRGEEMFVSQEVTFKEVRLSARVKSSEDEGLGEEDASKQGRIANIDVNEDLYLFNVHKDKDIFGVNDSDGDEVIVEDAKMLFDVADDLRGEEMFVSQEVTFKESAKLKTTTASSRPKAKGIVIHDQEQAPTPTVSSQQPSQIKDKRRGKMIEPEPVKRLSKKDQLAKINVDYELAQRLQVEEQDELTDPEKAKLFMEFLEKRRKFFAAKRSEEKRNRTPTRAQQRTIMCTYLKNIDGWKLKSLKKKYFAKIQELFDKAMKKVNTFIDFRTELVEESSKKAEAEITQKDGNSHMYLTFSKMLKNFDREDMEVLWRLVKDRFEKVKRVDNMDSFLLHNLKTMFEHHVKDNVWKNQQGFVKVKNWKLYDSFGVHCITMQNILYYLLVKKMYPLTNHTLYQMINDVKLQIDYECEMAFELLRLLSMKKLDILKKNIKFRGGLLGLKAFNKLLLLRQITAGGITDSPGVYINPGDPGGGLLQPKRNKETILGSRPTQGRRETPRRSLLHSI